MSRSGPGGDTRAYIWPRPWRKLETPTAPIRPGCAFDPKAILGSHACDQSLKLNRDCWAATSFFVRRSPPPVRPPTRSLPAQNFFRFHKQQRMPPIGQSLNHRLARIQKHRSVSLKRGRGCRRCRTINCCCRQRFSAISSALGLKIAAMAKTSNRNTCAPPPPSFQQERRAGDLSML